MVNFRINGFSFNSLSIFYKCDPSSIRDKCKKYNLKPYKDIFDISRIANQIIKKYSPKDEFGREFEERNGEKICKGKMYKDYLSPYKKGKIKA
jgi:hypothetical protein